MVRVRGVTQGKCPLQGGCACLMRSLHSCNEESQIVAEIQGESFKRKCSARDGAR